MTDDELDPRQAPDDGFESVAAPTADGATAAPPPAEEAPDTDAADPMHRAAPLAGDAGDAGDPVAEPAPPPLSEEELIAQAAAAPTPSADEIAALATAAATAVPFSGTHGARPSDVTSGSDGSAATASAIPRPSRRTRFRGLLTRIATLVLSAAFLGAGIALGVMAFDRTQPPPPAVGDASTGGVAAPPVVKELADALATNNSDSLRSAVGADPYRLLAGEMQSWNMQGVTSVETLATMQDGPRSVTEIIITGRTAAGDPAVFNLVVHVTDNQIVNFR